MFTHRQIIFQVLLVHPAERSQEIARRRPQPFDGIDVHLAHPVPVVVARPLALTVADGAACPLDSVITAPFIRVASGSRQRVAVHVPPQRRPVRVLADSQPTLPAAPPDGADHRGTVILVGGVAALLVRTPPRRVVRISVLFAFFPPRSETSRRSQSRRRRAARREAAHKHSAGSACASDARTGATVTTPRP
jgi:hypothetical protein